MDTLTLLELLSAAGLLLTKQLRALPTKQALAQALSTRYGGRPVEAEDIRDVMPFEDGLLQVQAYRNAYCDWYVMTVNYAGQVDHTSIAQLPF